jgi:hypothetical protein
MNQPRKDGPPPISLLRDEVQEWYPLTVSAPSRTNAKRKKKGVPPASETKLAIKGDEASFRAKGQNASRLADLIDNHSFTPTVNYGNFDPHPGGSNSNMLSAGLSSPSVIIDPRRPNSGYDTDAIAQHLPEANTAEKFGHEVLGHQWGELINGDFLLDRSLWWHPMTNTTRANMRDSITGENAVRALDPTRGQKDITSHHNYDEAPEDGYKP